MAWNTAPGASWPGNGRPDIFPDRLVDPPLGPNRTEPAVSQKPFPNPVGGYDSMRLTFLLAEPATYGGDRVIGRYAEELADRGHEIRFVVLGQVRDWAFYKRFEVEHEIGLKGYPRNRLDYLRAAARALPVLKGTDAIVATWTPTLPAAALGARFWGQALIWMQQDYPLMFDGLPIETRLLEGAAAWTDATIAVSDYCAEAALIGAPDAPVHVLHSGIDDAFLEEHAGIERNGVFFVGAPIYRKGWDTFMEAVERLRRDRPGLLVRHLGTPPETPCPGPYENLQGLSDRQVAEAYAASELYVCASRSEGWGLPALEAMAQACPVVSTDHDGCQAYARSGENLVLVPRGDSSAMAEGMRLLLNDPVTRGHLQKGGMQTARSYTWPRAAERFESIIRTAVERL